MNTVEKLGIGTTAVLATFGASEIDLPNLVQALTQLIIAVGTIIALFRKKNV